MITSDAVVLFKRDSVGVCGPVLMGFTAFLSGKN